MPKPNDPNEWKRDWEQPINHASPRFPLDGRETIYDPYEAYARTDSWRALLEATRRVRAGDPALPTDFDAYLSQRVIFVISDPPEPSIEENSTSATMIDRFGVLYEAGQDWDAHNDPGAWSHVWTHRPSRISPTWPRDYRDTMNRCYERFASTQTVGELRDAHRRVNEHDARLPEDFAAYLHQRTPLRISAYDDFLPNTALDRHGWAIAAHAYDSMYAEEWVELDTYLSACENRAHGGLTLSETLGYLAADISTSPALPTETWVRDILAFERICDPRCNRILAMLRAVRRDAPTPFPLAVGGDVETLFMSMFSEDIRGIAIDRDLVERGYAFRKR
jgi:hypothetical protein